MSSFPDTLPPLTTETDFALPGTAERRQHPRYPSSGRSLVYVLGRPDPLPARLRDISAGGALLEMAPLEVGSAVQVVFGGEASGFEIDGVVVRQTDLSSLRADVVGVGVRFDRLLPT